MVEDWINKKNLAKMGYSFLASDLTDFEVYCFRVIATKFEELEKARIANKG